MKQIKFIFFLLTLISSNFTEVLAFSGLEADKKNLQYLNNFREDYIQGMLQNKPELIEDYYAEDIRLMPEFQKTVIGKSNALSYHKAFSARFDVQEYKREEIEVLDLGSQVVELGRFRMKIKFKSTGKEHELEGKYQNFWKKLDGNKQELITEAWNYDHQVEITEDLRFEEVPSVIMALQPHLPINSTISFELAALKLSEVAIIQHDGKTWSRFYADDAIFMYSNNPIFQGRKALDEFFEKHTSEMPVFEKLDIRNDRIDDLGDYVIEYATHVANWRHGEYSGVSTGKNIGIWRREPDCSLRLIRKMVMYD